MLPDEPIFHALYTYTKALSVALGYRDRLTLLHSERVYGLSEELGRACGISTHALDILRIAASFHDIGKIGIPDHILLKPDHLEGEEWETMKRHSEIGQSIITSTDLEGAKEAALIIRHHHEHFDGSGYPDGLTGQDIPVDSRIISLADSYDAMAVTRAYHRARSHEEIIEIVQSEVGIKHDPDIMQIFLSVVESSKYKSAASRVKTA
jgi:response regulator RpfG family c-di-GMP phosphodiesterase